MRDGVSSWAVVDDDTLTKVFAMLPFNVKLDWFHSVTFGRHYHGLQLDDPQKVDYFYQLVLALGQAHSPPAVHVYVKGPTVLQLAHLPELVATSCQQGDEDNWDFKAVPPQYMTPTNRMRVEALAQALSDVIALQQ
ncbi:hypothetical protein WJX82_005426 [Trebouxia sp. C0006]